MTQRFTLDDARGAVLIEFLIVFIPVFVLFLGTFQFALLSAASLVVQHAATTGARSAQVVLDDDPKLYAGAARGALAQPGTRAAFGPALRFSRERPNDGPRMAAIRSAVHAKLAAIAPEPSAVADLPAGTGVGSVAAAIGSAGPTRLAFALSTYLPIAAAITFPVAPATNELYEHAVPAAADVTVRVTCLFPCLIPLAAHLLCDPLHFDRKRRSLSAGRPPEDARERALSELRWAPNAGAQAAFITGVAVAVLQAEATLPAQRARYAYRSEVDAGVKP